MSDFRSYEFGRGGSVSTVAVRNRVLRNTYWLLALSMIPTVVGAWLGMVVGLPMLMATTGPMVTLLVFFGVVFGLFAAINRYKDSAAGVGFLLALTFFLGLMLSSLIGRILGYSNGASLIMLAFGGTAIIFGSMATIATVSKRNFGGLMPWLTTGVMVLVLVSVANVWLHLPALTLTVSVLIMVACSAFILVDVQRVVNGGETNYVMATLGIYINLYNVFTSLLSILGIFGGNRN